MQNRGQKTPEAKKRPMTERERMAEKIYGGAKDGPDLLKVPGQLYGFAMLEAEIAKHERGFFTVFGEKAAEKARHYRTRGMAIAKATNEGLATRVASRLIAAEIAAARHPEGDVTERDAAERRNAEEALRRLQAAYGDKDAPEMLARTQKFVRSTPALAEAMGSHDLGSDPELVEGLAEFVFSQGYR